MTYITGGPIQALDYNTFATLSSSVNKVFADIHSGATTLPDAGYGYGQSPALTPVAQGEIVKAEEWADLFQAMRNLGTHQGTVVVPPLPAANPVTGDIVVAHNTPTQLSTVISSLLNNRFNLAPGQTTLSVGTSFVQPSGINPWVNALYFTFDVDFGSWNNARYFFNSGGSLNINGSYSAVVTQEDAAWSNLLSTMSPLIFNYSSSTPGTGAPTPVGFYSLNTVYQPILSKTPTGGGYYYAGNTLKVEAKLAATAGTNGIINFKITMLNTDATPDPKTSITTFRIDTVKSTGTVTYPGTVAIVTSGGSAGFSKT